MGFLDLFKEKKEVVVLEQPKEKYDFWRWLCDDGYESYADLNRGIFYYNSKKKGDKHLPKRSTKLIEGVWTDDN